MKKVNLRTVTALAVFTVMLVVYLMTAAPTISFWDNPEFVTCASILGVPHPPGSPLLLLVTRCVMLLPMSPSPEGGGGIAWRANLVAAFSGAFTALVTFLIMVRLLRRMTQPERLLRNDKLILFFAALSSILAGLSNQMWENSVENETYLPSLLVSLLALLLTLHWEERKEDPASLRYLLCAAYIIGLGIGIHLYAFLATPAVAIAVLMAKPRWFTGVKLCSAFIVITAVLVLAEKAGGRVFATTVMAVFSLAGPFIIVRFLPFGAGRQWRKMLAVSLLCLALFGAGYSVYPTVLVRASKNPTVNQGSPDSWGRYREYINRTQYGQGDMIAGIFQRSAPFSYQFGYLYIRYLLEQFPSWGPAMPVTFTNNRVPENPGMLTEVRRRVDVPVLLVLLLLLGMVAHLRSDSKTFWPFFLYFLLTSAGLVLYLNMENPQARERDYFFIGSFWCAFLWVGMGMYYVTAAMAQRLPARFSPYGTGLAIFLMATLIPASVLSRHIDPKYTSYRVHNRSDNWIPFDYAYNILQSCGENAILFTNGDNDTYPLWYAQYVEGIRPDVRVVNLSLLNAPWHIKQLRDERPRVPISLTDDFINSRLSDRSLRTFATLRWTPEPREVSAAGLTWLMPPDYVSPNGTAGFLTVASFMVHHIIKETDWTRPIYFTTFVDPAKMLGLYPYLSMEGLVLRLTREQSSEGGYSVNTEALERNLFEVYRFRGILDPAVYKSPETVKMLQNYFIAFIELCGRYADMGQAEDALRAAQRAYEFALEDPERLALLDHVVREKGISGDVKPFNSGASPGAGDADTP